MIAVVHVRNVSPLVREYTQVSKQVTRAIITATNKRNNQKGTTEKRELFGNTTTVALLLYLINVYILSNGSD